MTVNPKNPKNPEPRKPPILVSYDSLEEKASAFVSQSLEAEVAARFGPRDEAPFSILAYGDANLVVGGLNGATHWRWRHIRHFWVAASWRGRGVGRSLLQRAEADALARGCVGLYLDTFDPGAAQFYARCGFAPFGRIDDFPPGHARTFLYKKCFAP
jgi:GNAT superfamily N-acetyltransferase